MRGWWLKRQGLDAERGRRQLIGQDSQKWSHRKSGMKADPGGGIRSQHPARADSSGWDKKPRPVTGPVMGREEQKKRG